MAAISTTPPATNRADTSFTGSGKPNGRDMNATIPDKVGRHSRCRPESGPHHGDCLTGTVTATSATISESVRLETEGDVALVIVDNPPVNALSSHVRQGLFDGLNRAVSDGAKAIVVICDGRTFIAGADISEFGGAMKGASLQQVQAAMEDAPIPVIAAIHGTALGGGLEVALCAHYRVAVSSAKFGLPEVNLGLLPGAGGTQRLPRLVGVPMALEMMTSGRHISSTEALDNGLIDEVTASDDIAGLRAAAVAFAERAVAEQLPLKRVRDRDDKVAAAKGDTELFTNFRRSVAKKARGFLAPEYNIQCIEAAANLPFDEGLKVESEAVHRAGHRPAIGCPALRVLRRAGGEQDPRHRQGHADPRHRDGAACSVPARWAAASR